MSQSQTTIHQTIHQAPQMKRRTSYRSSRSAVRHNSGNGLALFEWTVEEKLKLTEFLKKRRNDQIILDYLRIAAPLPTVEETSPHEPMTFSDNFDLIATPSQAESLLLDPAERCLNILFGYQDITRRNRLHQRSHPGISILVSSLRNALDPC